MFDRITSHSRVGKGEFHPKSLSQNRTPKNGAGCEALTSYASCYAVNNSGHPLIVRTICSPFPNGKIN